MDNFAMFLENQSGFDKHHLPEDQQSLVQFLKTHYSADIVAFPVVEVTGTNSFPETGDFYDKVKLSSLFVLPSLPSWT